MEDLPANPAPMGYFALGVTLITIGSTQASLLDAGMVPVVVALLGGASLFVVGLLGYPSKNTFGLTAFTMLGMFWMSIGTLRALAKIDGSLTPDRQQMGWYLALWMILGGILFTASRRRSVAVQVVFAILTLWFGLFAAAEFTGNKTVTEMAGFEGIITGVISMYLAGALLINGIARRTVLPIGEPFMSTIIIPDDISQLFD